MTLIRVEYDAYNRRFKLLDRELARLLEDGEQYLLVADVAAKDLEPTDLETASCKSMMDAGMERTNFR